MTETVYIGMGANLGDRLATLRAAVEAIARLGTVERVSALYETAPMYVDEQPWFYNAALALGGAPEPRELLAALLDVERRLGRERGARPRNGPREVDLDIVLYGERVIDAPGLELPHPRMAERRFVLAPLAELAPELRHPVYGVTIGALLARCPDPDRPRRVEHALRGGGWWRRRGAATA